MRRYYLLGTETPTLISHQSKSITITENGSYEIKPDDGYLLDKVSVDVDTISSLDDDYFINQNRGKIYTIDNENYWKIEVKGSTTGNDILIGTVSAPYFLIQSYRGSYIIQTGSKYNTTNVRSGEVIEGWFDTDTNYNLNGETGKVLTDRINYNPNIYLNGSGEIIYYAKIYKNDTLVMDLVPKKIAGTTIHLLRDNVSQRVIAANTYDNISTLETPDYQTITLSNEEYQAIMPILEEMRGEEVVDNTPKHENGKILL